MSGHHAPAQVTTSCPPPVRGCPSGHSRPHGASRPTRHILHRHLLLAAAAFLASASAVGAADRVVHAFKRLQLSDQFYCEGVGVGDLNRDGKPDLVAGPFWYAGASFARRHEYRPAKAFDPADYSDNFLTFVWDFNQDQWPDILLIDIPSKAAFWYENPRGTAGTWLKHLAFPVVDNESPTLTDLTGDGRPELVFNTDGYLGYAEPQWREPTAGWQFHRLSPQGSWHKYTHGLGVGDVNGDGRQDLIEIGGWWEQPTSLTGDPTWRSHPAGFGEGGAQMYAYDFDGDGDNDILTILHPHRYGLAWFEQLPHTGRTTFRQHRILGEQELDSPYGLKFTQAHALDLADIDGDGVKDFVTGKRWWAHKPPMDPESDAPAVLYWFRTVRSGAGGAVDFVPHLIDTNSGVGMQVLARDLNGDGLLDVTLANKKGTFIFFQETKRVTEAEWQQAQPRRLQAPWQSLFTGQDLHGWTVKCKPADQGKRFWRVIDGAIEANSLGDPKHDYVWLVSEKEYGDFELRLRFEAFQDSPGNSGVQIRSRYDDAAGWLDGPQIDIHPPGPWRTGMIWDETRGNQRWLYPNVPRGQWVNESMANPNLKFHHGATVWNKLEITAVGVRLRAQLNGLKVMEYDGAGVLDDTVHRERRVGERGHIALQIHTGDALRIRFKDIEIRELPAPERAGNEVRE